jgi:hypothetical protein
MDDSQTLRPVGQLNIILVLTLMDIMFRHLAISPASYGGGVGTHF